MLLFNQILSNSMRRYSTWFSLNGSGESRVRETVQSALATGISQFGMDHLERSQSSHGADILDRDPAKFELKQTFYCFEPFILFCSGRKAKSESVPIPRAIIPKVRPCWCFPIHSILYSSVKMKIAPRNTSPRVGASIWYFTLPLVKGKGTPRTNSRIFLSSH